MMVIIKARLGTIAPPEKRVGFDLPASVTVPTAVRSLRRTRPGVSRRPYAPMAIWGGAVIGRGA